MRPTTKKKVTYGKTTYNQTQRHRGSATATFTDSGASTDPLSTPKPVASTPQSQHDEALRSEAAGLINAHGPKHFTRSSPGSQAEQETDYSGPRIKRRRLAQNRSLRTDSAIGHTTSSHGRLKKLNEDTTALSITTHKISNHARKGISNPRGGSPDATSDPTPTHETPSPASKLFDQESESYNGNINKQLPAHPSPEDTQHPSVTPPRRRLVDHLAASEGSGKESTSNVTEDHLPLWNNSTRHKPSGGKSNIIASPDSPNTRNAHPDTTQEPSSPARSGMRGSRVTYARQRSFLNDISLASEPEALGMPHKRALAPITSGCSFIKPSHGSDDESNDSRPVRSIHELRQAGDNARFRETVDMIFEDIENSCEPAHERCSGFIQLCESTLDSQFARRFLECNFGERLAENLRGGLDITSASLAVCVYRMVCADSSFPHALVNIFWHRLLELAPGLLEKDEKISLLLKEKSLRLPRAMQTSLRSLLPQVSSMIFGDPSTGLMSPRSLALTSIQHTLQKFRTTGDDVEPIPAPLLDQLVQLLSPNDCDNIRFPLCLRSFQKAASVFSILDTYTVLSGTLSRDQCKAFLPLRHMHRLLHTGQCEQSRRLLVLYVRVILNLTNKDLVLCNDFATPEILSGFVGIITARFSHISEDTITKEHGSLNTVILALGALINIAEKSDSLRALFLTPGCDSTQCFLQILLQQFSNDIDRIDQAHSVPEMHHNVALGYLAVLLVTLCLSTEVLPYVEKSLNGKGLVLAVSLAGEFLQYHRKLEQTAYPSDARDERGTRFTIRLEYIIGQVGRYLDYS